MRKACTLNTHLFMFYILKLLEGNKDPVLQLEQIFMH